MPSTRRTLDRFEEWYRKLAAAAVADAEAAGVAEAVEVVDAALVADPAARPERLPD
jgi:hypothetical protein